MLNGSVSWFQKLGSSIDDGDQFEDVADVILSYRTKSSTDPQGGEKLMWCVLTLSMVCQFFHSALSVSPPVYSVSAFSVSSVWSLNAPTMLSLCGWVDRRIQKRLEMVSLCEYQ